LLTLGLFAPLLGDVDDMSDRPQPFAAVVPADPFTCVWVRDHPDGAGVEAAVPLLADRNGFPDYIPSSAKFGHRTNHEKSNVLRFSPRLLTHRRPSPGRTIDQVARLKEGIYHI